MKYLLNKITNMIKRGYITRSIPDTGDYPTARVSYLGKDNVLFNVVNPYGVYSRLPTNLQVLVFNVNGYEDNPAGIGYSQQIRFKNLKEGEIVFGHPKTLSFVKFDEDGNIEIESTKDITITSAGKITINSTGDVTVNAPKVELGSGGKQIARKDDPVKVNVGGTDYFGTITGGGTNTSI